MNIEKAINILAVAQDNTMQWEYEGFINNETDFNNITVKNNKSFNFTWADVQAKATELETAEANEATAKENLKASAKAKLMAGEALTEEEANVMIGG